LGPHLLYYRCTLGSSYPIFWGYLQVLKSYIIGVPLDPHLLLYRGMDVAIPIPVNSNWYWLVSVLVFSRLYIWDTSWYPHGPLFRGTLRSSCTIIKRHSWRIMCNYFEVPLSPDVLLTLPPLIAPQ